MAQLAAWAELCTIQAKVTEIHNEPQQRLGNGVKAQRLTELDEALSTWNQQLPDSLRFVLGSNSAIKHPVYSLWLAYLATLIVLHRPLAGFGLARPPSSSNTRNGISKAEGDYDSSSSRRKCRSAAIEIGNVVKDFTSRYPPSKMPTIFTRMSFIASTTLIFEILTTEPSLRQQLSEERASLASCIDTIGKMASRFPSARHTRIVLLKILRNNNISLDESQGGQQPEPLNMVAEDAWRDMVDFPAFTLPSDLSWLLSSSSFENVNQFDPFPSGISPIETGSLPDRNAHLNTFPLQRAVEASGPFMDLPRMTASSPSMQQGLGMDWMQDPM